MAHLYAGRSGNQSSFPAANLTRSADSDNFGSCKTATWSPQCASQAARKSDPAALWCEIFWCSSFSPFVILTLWKWAFLGAVSVRTIPKRFRFTSPPSCHRYFSSPRHVFSSITFIIAALPNPLRYVYTRFAGLPLPFIKIGFRYPHVEPLHWHCTYVHTLRAKVKGIVCTGSMVVCTVKPKNWACTCAFVNDSPSFRLLPLGGPARSVKQN